MAPPIDMSSAAIQEQVCKPLHQDLVGISVAIQEVRSLIEQVAPTDLAVLITGETGTGKDLVARLLHAKSHRKNEAFIKVNCPSIQDTLVERELFGHEKGAFTGAVAGSPGRLELAHQGTLFLDEFSETPLSVQSKMLLALDGEPVVRIGGVDAHPADVRVIAATNVPLDVLVQQGRIHRDALFRLTEMVIHLPPLREHAEDIAVLAEHFSYNLSRLLSKTYRPLPPKALDEIGRQRWPGNARELSARIKEYLVSGDLSSLIEPEAAGRLRTEESSVRRASVVVQKPAAKREFPSLKDATRRAVEATERTLIEEALRYTLWNRRKAAKLLAISYSSLLRRIETYSIGRT